MTKVKLKSLTIFFASSSNVDDSNVPEPDSTCRKDQLLDKIIIQQKDVADLLKTLDISKATGPDQVSQVMLKKAGDVLVPHLTKLFNFSLENGIFPST